jgi:starch synthase (maltosyl-transferring)
VLFRSRKAAGKRLEALMDTYAGRDSAVRYPAELVVTVDRERARFGAWYEMFPRSCSPEAGKHGTFRDCENRLPAIRQMGFDVLYLPPIHPVGRTNRKGRNNSVASVEGDPGTPWAIGAEEGGHKAVLPALGTMEDFERLVGKASEYGIEIALDIALQCSPDHPYVREHPEWFRRRPDGSIAYAENPPKKYQDIYPFDFSTPGWKQLWEEMESIFRFWIDRGIRIFRVDNPHTKPFLFWERVISDIKREYPDVIFLAEAFTRPKVMYHLAKLGFSQSYTYFTWRNEKWEIADYMTELTRTPVREYFRPNFWPNTPDILSDYLRDGGRPAFLTRLILAATLSSSYGIYGPAFELCENRRRDSESEEYLYSEKYELKHWNTESGDSLAPVIATVNRIRNAHPALRDNSSLRFHGIDNDRILCYSKRDEGCDDTVLAAVNLDCRNTRSGWTDLDLDALGLEDGADFEVTDLLADATYTWKGRRNYVELNPQKMPAHIFSGARKTPEKR